MRTSFLLSLALLCAMPISLRSQVFWTETFDNGCSSGCGVGTYTGANGTWSQANTGANGTDANEFYVACAENGQVGGECGSACGSNNGSLHVGFTPSLLGVFGDGAVYLAGGLGFWFPQTDRRAESPVINCSGKTNITLTFQYLENGQGSTDNASVWYYDGATWSLLDDMPKTTLCGNGQGLWATRTLSLPSSADNNPGVRIGFRWVNNDDNVGTDPSLAVNDVTLSTPSANAPVASFSASVQTICAGGCVDFTNTSTGGPFTSTNWTFTGSSTPTSTQNNPTSVCYPAPGSYAVSLAVSGANGSDSETVAGYITVTPAPATPAPTSNAPVCAGSDLQLSTAAVNGATYTWTGPNGFSSSDQNPLLPNATTSMSGTYSVTVTVGSCTSAAGSVDVVVNTLPGSTTAGSNSPLCVGEDIQLTTPAITGATYSWTGPNGFSSTDQNPVITVAGPAATGSYTVTVSIGSCSLDPVSTAVVVNPAPPSPVAGSNSPVCPGETISLTTQAVAQTAYQWTGPNGFTSTSQNPVIANASEISEGVYTITLTNLSTGCSSAPDSLNVEVLDAPVLDATPSTAVIDQGETVQLDVTGGTTYEWSPDTGLSCSDCPNPVASPQETTTYVVTSENADGCVGIDQVTIVVNVPCGDVFVPTRFSPNGDDLNDFQCVLGTCITNMEFRIFNRWGETIFESTDPTNCWDGTFRGLEVEPGTYTYALRVTQEGGTETTQSGHLTLIR